MVTQHLPAQIFLLVAGLIGIGFTFLLPNTFSLIIGIGLTASAMIWFFYELFSEEGNER